MARLMLTHVSQNGTITYEHYCDTLSDRSEILDKYITLGSYCFVLHGTNGVDIYVADSNKTWCLTPTARPNLQIKNISTNGTVIADRGYDGLEQVIVRIPTNSEEELVLANKTITENGIYNPVDENLDGYDKVTVNIPINELLYNSNFLLNTTGQTYWNTNNSGTSSNNRVNIIDGWSAMECIVEQVENGLKIIPKKTNAYLLCQIPQYWFKEKNITASATINGELFSSTAPFASAFTNTSVGTLYLYSYSEFDNVFTLSFIDKIDQEIIINNTSLKLAT